MKKFLIIMFFSFLFSTTAFAATVATPPAPNPLFCIQNTGQGQEFYYFGDSSDKSIYTNDNRVDSTKIDALLMINGSIVKGYYPVVENGRSLVPIRVISEGLGFGVAWDADLQQATISSDETDITLTLESNAAQVNGKSYPLDAPAKLINESTYVPLRFLADTMDLQIGYEVGNVYFPIVWVCEKYDSSLIKVTEEEVHDLVMDMVNASVTDHSSLAPTIRTQLANDFDFIFDGDIYGRYWTVTATQMSKGKVSREVSYLVDKYTGETFTAWWAGIFPDINIGVFYIA